MRVASASRILLGPRIAVAVVLGTAWLANPAAAQTNLGFEAGGGGVPAGWRVLRADDRASGSGVAVDAGVAAEGAHSLRITQRTAAEYARVAQTVSAATFLASSAPGEPRRVRVSGLVREAGTAREEAALWLRVSGSKGAMFVDSRGDGRDRPAVTPQASDAPIAQTVAGAAARWSRHEIELPLPDDADEIVFGATLRGAGSAWFDDFGVAVVPVSGAVPSAAARGYLSAALDLMQKHALTRASVHWPALRAATLAHARGAQSTAESYFALRFALRELGDRHSYLLAPGPAATLLRAPVSNARTGRAAVAPSSELLAGGIGYVIVPGFAGGAPADQVRFAESVQQQLASLDSSVSCGWMLDLRLNTGGNLWPMLAGLGPVLGDGELAASVYPDASRRTIWYEHGRAGFGEYVQLRVAEPFMLRDPAAPLAVLIGERTASSAEVLVAALRGRPATRTFGAPTRGLSAGNRTFELADRAVLVLTVAATSDRTGRIELGPMAPDEPVAGGGAAVDGGAADAGEAADGHGVPDPVVAAASAWLAAQRSCRAAAAGAYGALP
jgi:hypothetical protein